jgi:dUTP pyrophosphatase
MLKRFINYLHLIANEPVKLKCVKLNSEAILPSKAHTGMFEDAAFDLYGTKDIMIQPNQRMMVGTQVSFIIPDGYWIKLGERSGLASKNGIQVLGGYIDCGYTGEVKVILFNSDKEPVLIPKGKAICQFTVEKLINASISELTLAMFTMKANERTRGEKGFGSSDVKN